MQQTPFGEVSLVTEGIQMPMRFPGQYADLETGYSYNYFRDYDPRLGRYVQNDPIGLFGGYNGYAYAVNNPVGGLDPSGLFTVAIGGDVTLAPGLGLKFAGGRFYSSDDGTGQSKSGQFVADAGLIGLELDASAGITFTFGDLSNFAGQGQTLGLDFGLFSLDLLFGGDDSFVGFGFSGSTPLPGI